MPDRTSRAGSDFPTDGGAEMLSRFKLILLQGLTLFLLGPTCEATTLGLAVHVVPLDSDEGKTVRAHFIAIATTPCPSLSGLCAEGEDCLVHSTSLPFTGNKPKGWCVRQWQKTVASNYSATISLGSSTDFYVFMRAGPVVRANSGRLNQPPFVALPPPLRARVNCPHHFHLSVKDLDGDRVRCRFARLELGECFFCSQHSFIELEEEKCTLTFTGKAAAGQYSIYLMVEDMIPGPRISHITESKPLSSVPVHLSLTVEETTSSCSNEPVATGGTPEEDSTLFVLPYQEVKFNINYMSQLESVSEVAVVGPPELFRVGFKTIGPVAIMTMAWVRSENKLARLLPICFAVNTKSLQSEPRCVWLYQREMRTLPAGTELRCEKTEMSLVLPISSLTNINLAELQLNSPTCPVTYNDTHLTAHISLSGCGTKTVQSGSELVFTNTLQTVRSYSRVSREPSLVLPLACRIPGIQAKGPQYNVELPTETETFGEVEFWIEIYLPGEGPMAQFTRNPSFRLLQFPERVRREAESPLPRNSTSSTNSTSTGSTNNSTSTGLAIGSRLKQLDLHVFSNCSIDRAELLVSNCIESATEDFAVSQPILEKGCATSDSTIEIITSETNTKIYRLDLSNVETKGSTMYVQCTVNLCITTQPSQKCPNLCSRALDPTVVVSSVYTKSYTISSKSISLVVTTPAPVTKAATTTTTTTVTPTTTTVTNTTPVQNTTTSHAPEQASTMTAGVILTTIGIFLQNIFLY